MTETHRYVHIAKAHMREFPEVLAAAAAEAHPDRRILKMLGARVQIEWKESEAGISCQNGAKSKRAGEKTPALSLV